MAYAPAGAACGCEVGGEAGPAGREFAMRTRIGDDAPSGSIVLRFPMRKVVAIAVAVVVCASLSRQLTAHEDFGPGLVSVATAANEATEIAVKELLVEEWGADPGQLSVWARLRQDLKIDSIDRIKLIKDLEVKFDIEISGKEAVQLVTVGDIIRLVGRKTAAR